MHQPEWDLEQCEVIQQPASCWQLVTAGPGTGKSAVACGRIARLIDHEGLSASNILLVSFTRAAIAELRHRIVDYAQAGESARYIRISTLDSLAFGLAGGADGNLPPTSLQGDSYDLSIGRAVGRLREKRPELMDAMSRLEHVIVDEAQDVTGVRADLVIEILTSLGPACGVTILADPGQAIYGFTTDGTDDSPAESALLERLQQAPPRGMVKRTLKHLHRVTNVTLRDVFQRSRQSLDASAGSSDLTSLLGAIRHDSRCDVGETPYDQVANFLARTSVSHCPLVLFRRRADVVIASSYASTAGIEHRLRMSGLPPVVRPWLGWLFGETVKAIIDRQEFDLLWETRSKLAAGPFAGEDREDCWKLLHRLCAGRRQGTLDLVELRRIVARARPPVELCHVDVGTKGPILATIHASKGREADTVMLVMPEASSANKVSEDMLAEERRVYYVGATRARKSLITATIRPRPVGYLRSSRVFRKVKPREAQLEVGQAGDVDAVAHLTWPDSRTVQQVLAAHAGELAALKGRAVPEEGFAIRLVLDHKDSDGVTRQIDVARMSEEFSKDFRELWGQVDQGRTLRPHLSIYRMAYMVGVGTVGVPESVRDGVRAPFDTSGLALAPVIKGFPLIRFVPRNNGGRSQ